MSVNPDIKGLLSKARELQAAVNQLQQRGSAGVELERVTEGLVASIKGLPAPQVEVNVPRPKRWYFTIERDGSGKMSRVIASSDDNYGK